MEVSQVIIRPIVSEKTYALAEAGKYTFRVHEKAHKTQIRQAIEQLFDVNVVDVRTASVKSKPKRRAYTFGRSRQWKKAIVQVQAGQTIPIFGTALEAANDSSNGPDPTPRADAVASPSRPRPDGALSAIRTSAS